MSRTPLSLAAAFIVTACSSPLFSGELAGYDGLATKIRFYYADNAKEEDGRCLRPTMQAITRTQIDEDTPEQLKITVRYRYIDERFERNPFDPDGFPLFFCEGFSNRTFTVDKSDDGLQITEMTGPIREKRPVVGG